jgi:anaerobic selenocysteine-containing dehydrogenase
MVNKLVGPEFPLPFQTSNGPTSAYFRVFESVVTGKPYPIRTIIAPGTQPTTSNRGTATVLEALKKVDFYVVLDVSRTADMNYADIVIPISSMYEIDHPFEGRGNWIMPRRKVIDPIGESKSDYEFWIELGARMGYGKHFWNGSVAEWKSEQLKSRGITLEQLNAQPQGIVRNTPRQPVYEKYEQAFSALSSRFSRAPYLPQKKVAIYNTSFEEAGFNPLPEWREPPESLTATPELAKNYPLLFSDFHTSKVFHASWLRNVPHLREMAPDPILQIHPATAKERGINHGDWVLVESPRNTLRLKADVNPGIRKDTVMALHGWWEGCEDLGKSELSLLKGGANTNSMYDTSAKAYDPIVTAMSSQTLVQVRKGTAIAANGEQQAPRTGAVKG